MNSALRRPAHIYNSSKISEMSNSQQWCNKIAETQPADVQDSFELWKGQNKVMDAAFDAILQFDSDIRIGLATIIYTMESAPCLPKGTIVWRAVPTKSKTLMKNPEKFMSVSATKEGALHFANGRAMRICKIEIGDDGIRGMPVRSKDPLLDAEEEIILYPGFEVEMVGQDRDVTSYKITKA